MNKYSVITFLVISEQNRVRLNLSVGTSSNIKRVRAEVGVNIFYNY